ncbi:NTP transferase domain-containing protein [Rasiella rasia]|uniref:NTP transferase domain-containing protein n=1 Tax=Rasiella rasia TaxID=2744027 RepID=A0A6G6GPZ1_9FLAO|nr:nucleotidyltransferase family protein [Rasiella rasia]QIE60618.1 NTP transferase domain-containing protein [Rasiella rasia]
MSSYKIYRDQLETFEDVIQHLDSYGVGFLAVVNRDETLYGIVTDGDIRKALLQQKRDIDTIINKAPITLHYSTPRSQIVSYLQSKRRLHIPLIDDAKILKQVFLLNDLNFEYKPNKVVIMAGGLGSRLGDLTKDTPKPMLEIKGKPILEYIVDSFKNQGFNKFIFCVNYKKEVIESYFGDGSRFNVSVEYIVEEKRLGTAGALSLIADDCFEDPFFVVNGDVISNIEYQHVLDFYNSNKAEAVMCTKELSHTNPYAEVYFDDQKNLISLKEKPTKIFHINLGVYLLHPKMTTLLPTNEFYDMPNLFLKAKSQEHMVKVFNVNEDWVDIGKPVDYHKISDD